MYFCGLTQNNNNKRVLFIAIRKNIEMGVKIFQLTLRRKSKQYFEIAFKLLQFNCL